MNIEIIRYSKGVSICPFPTYLEKYLAYTHRSFKTVGWKRVNSYEKKILHTMLPDGCAATMQGFYHAVLELIHKNLDTYTVEDRRSPMPAIDWENVKALNLRDYHLPNVVKMLLADESGIVNAGTGVGKCLGRGTSVIMFDGTIKLVENIIVGDLLMGPDSCARKVVSICNGKEQLYNIKQCKGDDYVVNESHILSLKVVNYKLDGWFKSGEIVNIPLTDYVSAGVDIKKLLRGWKAKVKFITGATSITCGIDEDSYLTEIAVEPLGEGEYFGFELEGNDRLFLLGDFTVTHNTWLQAAFCAAYPTLNTIIAIPSKNVFTNTYKQFKKLFPHLDIGLMGDGHRDVGKNITISSYRSLESCALDRCDMLLMDEIQNVATPLVQATLGRTEPKRIIGFTATDEKLFSQADKLIKGIFGERLIEIDYDDAVDIGAVVPCKVFMVRTRQDWFFTATTTEQKIKKGIKCCKQRNALIGEALKLVPEGWQTLTFVDTIKDHMVGLLPYMPEGTKFVHRESSKKKVAEFALTAKEQDRLCDDFKYNRIQHMMATEALEAGTDFPNLRVVVVAGGGSNFVSLTQKGGRGARILTEEFQTELGVTAKDYFVLLDCYDMHDDFLEGQSKKREQIYRDHGWEVTIVNNPKDIKWIS